MGSIVRRASGLSLALVLAACSGTGASPSAAPASPAASAAPASEAPASVAPASVAPEPSAGFSAAPVGGISGALLPSERSLWVYDQATGKFNTVDGDASQPYVPNLRPADKKYKFAFAEGWAAIPFSVAINKGMYADAEQIGVDLIYCDQEFKAEKAVTCAEQLTQQDPDWALVSNWQAGAAESIMKIYDGAKVPVVNIDVWHPNGIFLGADNYVSGQIGGKAAGEHAKSLDRCADVTIFLGVNPGEGDAAAQRLAGFSDGVQEVCGPIPADRIKTEIIDAGTTEQALTKTTDWLTANPNAGYVLSTTIDDARSAGVSKALAQSSREGVAVGLGCDDIGVAATKEGDPEQTHFLGCVAYFPEKYPDIAMSLALDILAGTPVPNEVHSEHQFLDKASIASVYP
jgi:ribose transport system substrate-binding protein